ncbi:MAG TPA: hypothetical protein VLJ39_01050 [Tepidisphaeraceae bacterium]|jgi:hypothetical protein|nr:hypothetical protein [Tepidisphaeraceae bacterium]
MNQFATLVAAELQSGLLPYSRRAELLRWAQSRKVNRFDANLVIASVQHQMGQLSVERIEFQPSRGRLTGLFWIGVMQTILAIAVWALFIR